MPKGTMTKSRGFTLIEILVVVAIIGILSSVILVGLGPTRARGRDARRIADLRQVQTGLELYFGKCGFYPGTATCTGSGAVPAGGWVGLQTALTSAGIGISNIPDDPNSSLNYFYGVNGAGNGYTLGATLEDPANPALNNSVKGFSNGVNCGGVVYCIQL